MENGKRVPFQYYVYPKDVSYIVTDERGVELAEWVNDQTSLMGEPMCYSALA